MRFSGLVGLLIEGVCLLCITDQPCETVDGGLVGASITMRAGCVACWRLSAVKLLDRSFSGSAELGRVWLASGVL